MERTEPGGHGAQGLAHVQEPSMPIAGQGGGGGGVLVRCGPAPQEDQAMRVKLGLRHVFAT